VLVPGAKAPKLVTNEQVSRDEAGQRAGRHLDRPGRLLRGLAADDARDPTYRVHDSVFYCVANMPGAVPHTSTYALTNVTLPYAVELANRGWEAALRADAALAKGLNTQGGAVTNQPVAQAHDLPFRPLADVLA
jgi:alanine dehydrogenase